MNTDTLASTLRRLMRDHNETQYTLPKAAGVTQSTLQRILSGETLEPKLSTLERLADYFEVTVGELRGKPAESSAALPDPTADQVSAIVGIMERTIKKHSLVMTTEEKQVFAALLFEACADGDLTDSAAQALAKSVKFKK